MANTKSAKKRLRQEKKRRQRNRWVKNRVKKAVKLALKTMENGNTAEDIKNLVKKAVSLIDKAVSKGVFHRNKASRKKSRIMKKLNIFIKNRAKKQE